MPKPERYCHFALGVAFMARAVGYLAGVFVVVDVGDVVKLKCWCRVVANPALSSELGQQSLRA